MIKRAQVYGMRCSGTNYLEALLAKNFPNLQVLATTFEVNANYGWKHSDVGTTVRSYAGGKPKDVKMLHLDWPSSNETILFVLYRSPFTWLQSLHLSPHHAHEFYGLDFSTFIRKEWRAFYSEPGSESAHSKKERMKWVKEKYLWERYPSVLVKRQNKVAIFESFKYRYQHVAYLNYESLVQDPERAIREIAEAYGLRRKSEFENVGGYKGERGHTFTKKEYAPIDTNDLWHLLSYIDWNDERAIGYDLKSSAFLQAMSERARKEPNALLHVVRKHRYYIRNELNYVLSAAGVLTTAL